MITCAQISSPPHWHVPTDFRAAPWRATFCTLLSAISSRSFLLPLAARQNSASAYSDPFRDEEDSRFGWQSRKIIPEEKRRRKKKSTDFIEISGRILFGDFT
jgi:hypothetical protein